MSDIGPVLDALANDTRREIVARLAGGATPTATELASDLPISRQAVTRHLQILEDARVVTAHREGREIRYEIEAAALDGARAWIDEISATWDRRLALLKRRAEADREK